MLHCSKTTELKLKHQVNAWSKNEQKMQLKSKSFIHKNKLTVVQQVCDVEAERGQDGVEHFEVFSKARHEQQEAGRSLEGNQYT